MHPVLSDTSPLEKACLRRWQQVMAALRQDVARLKARHPDLLRVFVFGSYARGDWHGNSDVDVLCLVQNMDARRVFSGADFPAVTEGLDLAMDVLEVARPEWGPLADRPDWQPIMRDLKEVLDD